MRKLIIVLCIISAVALSCKKENPYRIINPESVVWNHITNEYLISMAGTGNILSLQNKQKFSVFNKTKLVSPKGMAVSEDNVYVTNVTQIVGYKLKNGKEILRYDVPGAVYLNDIAVSTDNQIFASDMKNNSIVMYNSVKKKGETFKHKDLNSPNGLYYVQQDTTSLLYIVSFRADAPIQMLNLKSRELKAIPNTIVFLADGITKDLEGNWLVSSWTDKILHKFKPDFSDRTKLTDAFQSPADIYYSTVNKELAIPLFEKNSINFVTQIDTTKVNKK